MKHIVLVMLTLTLVVSGLPAQADTIIHREKSLYRNILVKDSGSRRCLVFSVKREHRAQTCMDLNDPNRVVFHYARMTFAGLLLNPTPRRALMIGMGGGTISNVLAELYPDLEMDLVEVDQAVVNVARDYFDFKENDNTKVHVIDGRVFTKRAALRGDRYDMIILDAFTGEYIPEHLMTREFLEDVKSLMTEDGVMVANTFASSDLYDHESVTYRLVFGQFFNFKRSGTGNRVIVASARALPIRNDLQAVAEVLAPELGPYGIEIRKFPGQMDRRQDWNTRKRPLTDQYSPANLLRDN